MAWTVDGGLKNEAVVSHVRQQAKREERREREKESGERGCGCYIILTKTPYNVT